MRVTNNAKGPQGVHTISGVVYLRAGETRDDLALTDYGLRQASRLPFIALTDVDEAKGKKSKAQE